MRENQDAENDNRVSAKHSALAHSKISNGGKERNSSIELLRIIAMFMILAHHFIDHNGYDVMKLPLGPERIFFHLALAATVLVIRGLTSFIPGMIGINDGFFGFIYLFILISAYKWYMEPFTTRQVWLMIGTGLGFSCCTPAPP